MNLKSSAMSPPVLPVLGKADHSVAVDDRGRGIQSRLRSRDRRRGVVFANGTTLKALVEHGLRQVLGDASREQQPFRLRQASFGGRGLQRELRSASWEQVRDLVYGQPAP